MGQTQEILSTVQQRALTFLTEQPVLKDFYLSGGTALAAFYLHHRYSEDLDFFSSQPVDSRQILTIINKLAEELNAKNTRYEHLHDRHLFFLDLTKEELKLEFTY